MSLIDQLRSLVPGLGTDWGAPLSALSGRAARVVDGVARHRTRTLRLFGLRAPVELRWDEAGIPHLSAESRHDLFLAQGYVVGRARGFQLDFNRRATSGRLAEILGRHPVGWRELTVHLKDKTVADADLLLRTMGLRRAAEACLPRHSAAARAALEAYADGVTQALRRHRPLEARLLRYEPEPWSAVDSLTIVRGMAFELSMSWRSVLMFDALAHRLGDDPERLRALLPSWPDLPAPPAKWAELRAHAADSVAVEEALRTFTATGGAHLGSNAWVVAGARTTTGKPLVASDPHLMLSAPTPHFPMHLACPDLEVAGACVPGIPGVVFGHNRDVAWGITASCASDADVFVEEVDFGRGVYRTEEGWAPLASRTEHIRIKGEDRPWSVEVYQTRHGPLIHHATRALAEAQRRPHFAHAVRWIGHDDSADLDGLLGINQATDWASFRAALRKLRAPQLNFVYGDTRGHIGWQLAGAFPVRADGSDGLRPADGPSDAARWTRTLDLDELPHLYDPSTGAIVSANTRPVDAGYPHVLGHTFEPPFRYERIRALLDARPLHDLDSLRRIQNDSASPWAERVHQRIVRPALASPTRELGPVAAQLRTTLLAWDGQPTADSAGAAIFYVLHDHLVHRLVVDTLGDELAVAYLELLNVSVLPLERLLEADDPRILRGVDVRARVTEALLEAEQTLIARLGPDPSTWSWGRLHVLWNRHRMHDVAALRPLFSVGPFPRPGDGFSVNNAHAYHSRPHDVLLGPGVRLLMDTADWSQSRVVLSTGVSGDPRSPRYRDHAQAWAEGRDFPLSFGLEAGRSGVTERLEPRHDGGHQDASGAPQRQER